MTAIALTGPEDTNVIYTADPNEHLAARLKNQYEDGGRRVTTLIASQYRNEIERVRRFTTANYKIRSAVSDADIVIVSDLQNANKKTLDALIELVIHRNIDGVHVSNVEAVVFVVPDLKSPNVKRLQKLAGRK